LQSNETRRGSGGETRPHVECVIALGIAVAVVACFLPVVFNDFVDWDDPEAFANNPFFRGLGSDQLRWMFGNFLLGHYQPLAWVTLGLDYSLWGMNPAGYHLTSLLLHAANAVLCFLAIDTLLRVRGAEGAAVPWAAAAGALFFALHPLRVEPVAWAAIRGDTLAALFFLAALLAYLKGRVGICLLLFALSLLSKATALALPVVLLVLDYTTTGRARRESAPRIWVEKIPFFALTGLAMLVAFQAKNMARAVVPSQGDVVHGLLERVLQAGYGASFYLAKTLVPTNLVPLYPLERTFESPAPLYFVCVAFIIATSVVLIAMRRRVPALLGAWIAYGALVSPVLGFAQSGPQLAADRYTYLACLPASALLAGALVHLTSGGGRPAGRSRLVAGGVALVLVALGGASFVQSRIWHDSLTLWNRIVEVHPESGLVHFYRANTRRTTGDPEGAIADYDRALALRIPLQSDTLMNRGTTWQLMGDRGQALEDMSEAIRIDPQARWYLNRGSVRVESDPTAAIADWSEALRLDPDLVDAYHARAAARDVLGMRSGAIEDYRAALERASPQWPPRAQVEGRLAYLRANRPVP
jgi:tetratricopeptide (TPR) repeat protein